MAEYYLAPTVHRERKKAWDEARAERLKPFKKEIEAYFDEQIKKYVKPRPI